MNRLVLTIILLTAYIAITLPLSASLKSRPDLVKLGYTPSAEVLKYITADQKLLAAQWNVLKVLFYYGTLLDKWRHNIPVAAEYYNMYRTICVAAKLDPYNIDIYYFAQAAFTWEVGRVKEVNALLEYGIKYRTWDWYLPFFAGFNYGYFLHDYKQAAKYLQRAAELSGQQYLATLAARYYYQSDSTEMGIAFLKTMLKQASDARERRMYQLRIQALSAIKYLQDAVRKYIRDNGHPPRDLKTLVSSGYIEKLPRDPYGGHFYVDKNGKVKTTSKLALHGKNSDNPT